MKKPASPPDLDKLMQEMQHQPEKLMRALQLSGQASSQDYLPWDKIRFKTPPEGLTHEEWWFGIRMGRTAMRRPLPLFMTDGRSFTYALPDSILRLAEEISMRAGGSIASAEQVTNPATRDRYIVTSLIEEAITSSQLEGAATTRQVAKEMIRTGRPPRDKSERMILNNYFAMRRVSELREQSLTPDLICEIHRVVTEGTLNDPSAAGRIQSNPDPTDRVAIFSAEDELLHQPPAVEQLPLRMEQLCRFANGGEPGDVYLHPVLRALAVHFMVGHDHYFEDGNGRTARALFYWVMLKQGYWLTEFLTISRILKKAPAKYARSFMLTEQDGGDLTYFFLYHLEVIVRAINDLDEYLARKVKELRETRVFLASTPGEYNHRQLALLERALKEPSHSFTAQSHALSHNVSTETARQDLVNLTRRGLLTQERIKRQFVWHPVKNLADMIRKSQSA